MYIAALTPVSIPHVITQLRKKAISNISKSTSPNLFKFGRILDGHEIHIPAKSYQCVKSNFPENGGEGGFLGSFAAGGRVFLDKDLKFKLEVGTTMADLYKKFDQNCLSNF